LTMFAPVKGTPLAYVNVSLQEAAKRGRR